MGDLKKNNSFHNKWNTPQHTLIDIYDQESNEEGY